MILLYTLLLIVLGTISFLLGRRVAGLEKKFIRTADAVEDLTRGNLPFRQGNSSTKLDTAESAKRQFVLGQLVQKRDALEVKCHAWQARADRFGKVVAALRDWKGRKLPYTMGALDVSGAMYAIDYFGVGHYINFERLMQLATTLVSQS
jgi:hypothetical protein